MISKGQVTIPRALRQQLGLALRPWMLKSQRPPTPPACCACDRARYKFVGSYFEEEADTDAPQDPPVPVKMTPLLTQSLALRKASLP